MRLAEITEAFSALDLTALAVLLISWVGSTWIIDTPPRGRPSMASLVAQYRRDWMQVFVTRQPRIFDSQIIATLRQGTTFFASACMIAIGGGLALLGNAERLRDVAQDLTQTASPIVVWEIKLIVILLFAANAFLKFVWSHRLFGYCAVLMAAVPNDPQDPLTGPRAHKAGELNVTGAKSYNRGLRAVYFGIGSAAWLAGAVPLIVATLFTLGVILRREFMSQSRSVLLMSETGR
jgi:uncharacterized membrane protein